MKNMKTVKNTLLFLTIAFSMFSCATAYQEKSIFGYGYSEDDAGNDKKRFFFIGSFATNTNDAEAFVHRRASAYCKSQNSDGYELLDEIIVGREKNQKDRDFVKVKHLSPPAVTIVIRCIGGDDEVDDG